MDVCAFSGMGPVHMNEVDCSGFEKSLTDCYFNNDALGCSHEEDAAVRCNIPAMGFQKRVRTLPTYSVNVLTLVSNSRITKIMKQWILLATTDTSKRRKKPIRGTCGGSD